MRLIASIWILALLMQTFSKDLIILNFRFNQKFIASYLCVNRDKPQLHCNGHCFLKKQLEKDHQRDATQNSADKGILDILYCSMNDHLQLPFIPSNILYFFLQTRSLLHPALRAIFHPPASLGIV